MRMGTPTRPFKGKSLQSLTQAGAATVKLRVNRGTNIIRVSILYTNYALEGTTHVVTYFYNGRTLKKVSGEVQVGASETQLGEPLIVEVRDWYPTSTPGTAVPDQEITFSHSGGTGFRPHSENPDLDDVDGKRTYPQTHSQSKNR